MARVTDRVRRDSAWICLLLLLLPAICTAFSEETPTDRRILVLLDDFSIQSSHSIFFRSLTGAGYELDFKLADDAHLALQKYGEYLYDALIVFAPSTEGLGGSLDVAAILEFVDAGHDLILAADTHTSDTVRDLATECGVDFDEEADSVVVDHINYATHSGGDHSLIVSDNFLESKVLLGSDKLEAPVLFRGIGHLANPGSELVMKVLSGSDSAFSGNPKSEQTDPPGLSGSSIGLISVLQARNNARVLISGSLDFFSNKFFKSPVQKSGSSTRYQKSGNEQAAVELAKWAFHERGHLKAVNISHHKAGEIDEPSVYRIKDDLEYAMEIYEWTDGRWQPYRADDVQVQFYMMSPYVVKNLEHNNKGLYSTSFQVPDVYGVFQFKVEYKKLGYTTLSLKKQIPVRPFRHNEYERFITSAIPYYGGSLSMMVGFLVFGFAFLYYKD